MWKWLFAPAPMKVWLVEVSHIWHKVVSSQKPGIKFFSTEVMGPFRSEIDAEETADRLNLVSLKGRVPLYFPRKKTDGVVDE